MKFEIEGKDMRKKIASSSGGSSKVYLPKSWEGKQVVVILLE